MRCAQVLEKQPLRRAYGTAPSLEPSQFLEYERRVRATRSEVRATDDNTIRGD